MSFVVLLNVTVNPGCFHRALQGFVVPVQVDGPLRLSGALHPANVDPRRSRHERHRRAVDRRRKIAVHVLETVCDAAFAPVPPHEVGAFTVPLLTVIVTEPAPVPAN